MSNMSVNSYDKMPEETQNKIVNNESMGSQNQKKISNLIKKKNTVPKKNTVNKKKNIKSKDSKKKTTLKGDGNTKNGSDKTNATKSKATPIKEKKSSYETANQYGASKVKSKFNNSNTNKVVSSKSTSSSKPSKNISEVKNALKTITKLCDSVKVNKGKISATLGSRVPKSLRGSQIEIKNVNNVYHVTVSNFRNVSQKLEASKFFQMNFGSIVKGIKNLNKGISGIQIDVKGVSSYKESFVSNKSQKSNDSSNKDDKGNEQKGKNQSKKK